MDQNTFYRGAIEALTSTLELHEGLQKCLHFVAQSIPCEIMSIHLWDEDLLALKIHAVASHQRAFIFDKVLPIHEHHRHLTRWEAGYGIRRFNNTLDDPISVMVETAINEKFGDKHYSHMISRVQIDGHRICDVVVMAEAPQQFTLEHEALFSGLDQPFGIAVSNAIKHLEITELHKQLVGDNKKLRNQLNTNALPDEIIGSETGLKTVIGKVKEVAFTDVPVLITGETGTGKDVIANAIQALSSRSHESFVRINCGAIPETLLDSELFGHEKGAFTGAQNRKMGRFERANNGTIFLDEVGELSKAAQVKLLRVLQNGELERVGANEVTKINVRVIAATNQALENLVETGEFRSDLYYRLCLFPIKIPALRERAEDIPLFVRSFIENAVYKFKLPPPLVANGEVERLQALPWPGNIRELFNVVERTVLQCINKPLVFDLNLASLDCEPNLEIAQNLEKQSSEILMSLDAMTVQYIEKALTITQGRIQGKDGAAEILDVNPYTLRSKIKKFNIDYKNTSYSK